MKHPAGMGRFLAAAVVVVALAALAFPWRATAGKNVLLLNSDSSIGNYLMAQNGFKTVMDGVTAVDLGGKWVNGAKVQDIILDEDPEVIYCIGAKAFSLAAKLAPNKKLIFSSTIGWERLLHNQAVW